MIFVILLIRINFNIPNTPRNPVELFPVWNESSGSELKKSIQNLPPRMYLLAIIKGL